MLTVGADIAKHCCSVDKENKSIKETEKEESQVLGKRWNVIAPNSERESYKDVKVSTTKNVCTTYERKL